MKRDPQRAPLTVISALRSSASELQRSSAIACLMFCAGKTHSMMGPGFDGRALGESSSSSSSSSNAVTGEPGLIPRVMASLFSQISALESDTIGFQMRACYIEIYQV